MARVAEMDGVLNDALEVGRLELIGSGNGAPLIDLSRVSPQLARAAGGDSVDLLVLEGMGRAVETNLSARSKVETLKLAMVKDEGVAEALGGKVYDLVMGYEGI